MKTVLFICSGNTCRSPMAEAVARHWLRGGGLTTLDASDGADDAGGDGSNLLVASAGVFAADGVPTSPEAIEALERLGIEHEGRSKLLTSEMIRKADVILCMTESHLVAVNAIAEESYAADDLSSVVIERLDPNEDVGDPIGCGQEAYDEVLAHFQTVIPNRLKELLSHEGRTGVGSSR